jgi:glucose-1-phosphate cytidylyltransferase
LKVIILAGGLGTRISEETENKPKPMVLIDDKPILWHLMSIFSRQGYDEFVLALGYRSDVIKRWLLDLNDLSGDIEINTLSRKVIHHGEQEKLSWKVVALETGLNTQTGGRIARCMKFIPGERVIATYGDGLANINIDKLLAFHLSHGKKATVSAVRPPARFGHMEFNGSVVTHFGEKNQIDAGWVNGGFFVLEPEVSNFVLNPDEPFETGALPRLADEGELMAYKHDGFWMPMDTIREKNKLVELANLPTPPWLNF